MPAGLRQLHALTGGGHCARAAPVPALLRLRGATLAREPRLPWLLRLRGAELSRERRGRFPGDVGGAGAAIMAAAAAAAGPRRGRLGREARASLAAFLLGASVAALPVALGSSPALLAAPGLRGRLALVLHVAGVNAALLLLYPRPLYKVRGEAPGERARGAAGKGRPRGSERGGRGRPRGTAVGGHQAWAIRTREAAAAALSPLPLLADRRPGLLPGLRLRLRAAAQCRPFRLAPLRMVRDEPGEPGSCDGPRPCQALPSSRRRYMCSLSLFHYSEYLVTAINNPRSLSLDSFLLNHSFEYNLAALSSWVEFTLEKLLFPGWPPCPSLAPTLLPAVP